MGKESIKSRNGPTPTASCFRGKKKEKPDSAILAGKILEARSPRKACTEEPLQNSSGVTLIRGLLLGVATEHPAMGEGTGHGSSGGGRVDEIGGLGAS